MTPQEMYDTRAVVVCETPEETRLAAELIVSLGLPHSGLVGRLASGAKIYHINAFRRDADTDDIFAMRYFGPPGDGDVPINGDVPIITAAEFLTWDVEDAPEPDPIDLNMFFRMDE